MPTEHEAVEPRPTLREVLTNAINRCSAENGSNTPDFILAETLVAFLGAFNHGVTERDRWYGVALKPGEGPWTKASEDEVPDIPRVRADLERERLAARASLAALLLITDPRASQHVAAALDEATRTERERVLALARQVARDCPMGSIVASAFQTLQQDIANGETPEKPRRRDDAEATCDAAHALARLDELRNTAIPCARIRDELLAPARRLLGDMIREADAQQLVTNPKNPEAARP